MGEASLKPAPAPGTVLCGKYRVERPLGRGGMGAVVLATHLKLERPVAIKLMPESHDSYLAQRFVREAKALARLTSDHVVKVLDLDEADGAPVLVMEYLDGVDLERKLKQGRASREQAVDWALQACAALAEAHARGVVHRDVKPANLFLVDRPDGVEHVKLLDFGISKVSGEDLKLTRTAMGLGSPLFMSPEQLLAPREVDARTDVWSLGVTLFRLLSGVSPYEADDAASLAAQIAARPPQELAAIAPAHPPELSRAVMRALEKDVSRRWPDVLSLAEALAPFAKPGGLGTLALVKLSDALGRRPLPELAPVPSGPRTLSHDIPRVEVPPVVAAVPPPPVSVTANPPPQGRGRWLAAAAVLLVVVGGSWAVLGRRPEAPKETPPAPPPVAVKPPVEVKPEPVAAPPTEPNTAPLAAPPSVTTVPDKKPRDAKKPGDRKDPKDPADLEIKE